MFLGRHGSVCVVRSQFRAANSNQRESTMSEAMNRITNQATRRLRGRKVVRVRYMTPNEAAELGWDQCAPVIEFDDGSILYVACDEEGNNAGVMFVQNDQTDLCLGRFPA
jgi:hypothetical protein